MHKKDGLMKTQKKILIYTVFKSFDYSVIFSTIQHLAEKHNILITIISLLLLVGAVGKSAQLGLHTWLPDAMEGPTPVSALIHAATMVTAGVFLLIRCSPLLEFAPLGLSVIVIIGALTAFFAASVGLVQNDIKKVIAYSTCSQLGYMVLACGLSNYSTSLFHLINHGFFKALLFLSAGSVIHAMADEQDMRKLGALVRALPFTYTMILIGSLSLMGFPFLTGFYSKDAILELAYAKFTIEGSFAHWLGTLSALFTAFYSFRLIYLTFVAESNAPQKTFVHAHESPWNMSFPLVILAIGSIFVGYIFKDAFIGLGSSFFNAAILTRNGDNTIEAEFLSPLIKWGPVIFSMLGALFAFLIYSLAKKAHSFSFYLHTPLLQSLYTFFNNKWHWDFVYNSFIAKPLLVFGHNVSYKILDRGLIEFIGPYGLSLLISRWALLLSRVQSGSVCNYAFIIFVFATLFLFFVYLPSLGLGGLFDSLFEIDLLLSLPFVLPVLWLTS